MNKKTVYFFCTDSKRDEVAPMVFQASKDILNLTETDIMVDDYPVLKYEVAGNTIYYVRTSIIICEDYIKYVPMINQHFSDCDLAVMVNWHGGNNAPDKILCIHTIGDIATATYSPSSPIPSTGLARAMERNRKMLELEDFRVTTEATHWSGVVYGGEAAWLNECKVPFLDVEIGSTLESFNNPAAVEVIAKALAEVFDEEEKYPTALYIGGMHFENTITDAVLHQTHPVSLTHILSSRWVEIDMYAGEVGVSNLMKCISSIVGGIDGIVIHEKLAREQKDVVAIVAERLGVPVIKRKALKTPENTVLYNK